VLGDRFEFGEGGALLLERNVNVMLDAFRALTCILAKKLLVSPRGMREETIPSP
jgi:hypothetical protein